MGGRFLHLCYFKKEFSTSTNEGPTCEKSMYAEPRYRDWNLETMTTSTTTPDNKMNTKAEKSILKTPFADFADS